MTDANSTGRRVVIHVGAKLGEKAIGVDRRPISVVQRLAVVAVPGANAIAEAAEGIKFRGTARVERHPKIGERQQVPFQSVTQVIDRLRDAVALLDDLTGVRVDRVVDPGQVEESAVRKGTISGLAVQELTEEPERAPSQLDSDTAVHVRRGAVVVVALA